MSLHSYKLKKHPGGVLFKFTRRGRDLNPRNLAVYRFSRPAVSTTHTPLHFTRSPSGGLTNAYFIIPNFCLSRFLSWRINASASCAAQANSSCPPLLDKKRWECGIWSARRAVMRQGIVASVLLIHTRVGAVKLPARRVLSKRLNHKKGVTNAL